MNDPVILNDPAAIDLGHHGVIEAHAGTGKTYTIIRMVLRILEQPVEGDDGNRRAVHIREVLLVTFTEKAAGELKRRIRDGIEERILHLRTNNAGNDSPMIMHLEDCLNNLHEALIGTIHAICLRLLQTWPFETGVHFTTQIVNDAEGLIAAQRESLRTDWQEEHTGIPRALELLQKQGTVLEEKQFEFMRDIAARRLDRENTVLDRGGVNGLGLNALLAQLELNQADLDDRESADAFRVAVGALATGLERMAGCPGLEPERLVLLNKRTGELRGMCRSATYDPKILGAPCKVGRSGIYTKAHVKKIPDLAMIDTLCDTICAHPYLAHLQAGEELSAVLPLTLFCDGAELLCDRWNRTKQEHGYISFQDMLRLMHTAVLRNESFRIALRSRLHYGIIDEFQDTSIVQWQIFRRIFLEPAESSGPRLFIVGDPKQSIYSFQGADVQSYLDAKDAIVKENGAVYCLVSNYRSLPETIAGYNAVLAGSGGAGDWFAFEESADGTGRITYPAEGAGGALARPPDIRTTLPRHTLGHKPVQIMVLEGGAQRRREAMTAQVCAVVKSLKGTVVSLPKGARWNDVTLDYGDCAVIVETHHLAQPFLERFRQEGIPAVKYKMEGVLQSPLARDLHALLRAVVHCQGDPAPRIAALLTNFFNRDPAHIDPENELQPCAHGCGHGDTCLAHALQEWTYLAVRRHWARLFKSILLRTGVRERLIRLADGERSLADLRQVIDYSITALYRDHLNLPQLVEHLGRILREEESVGLDQNLHELATGKSSVKVLTMHAAKGLEFPVVFMATGGSKKTPKGPGTLSWIDNTHCKHLMPFLRVEDVRRGGRSPGTAPEDAMMMQARQERRRLLYVALTRAQGMLFVPLHLHDTHGGGHHRWQDAQLPSSPDEELTPQLCRLLDKEEPAVSLFKAGDWLPDQSAPGSDVRGVRVSVPLAPFPDIHELRLLSRICRQTSYSQLSRRMTHDRDADRSEEDNEHEPLAGLKNTAAAPLLPGGKKTGDALHLALEEVLRTDDIRATIGDPDRLRAITHTYLDRNRVLGPPGTADRSNQAVDTAVGFITFALGTPLPLPAGESVAIADLPLSGRVAEMEFLLGVAPHWVHGYMDLVFRVENKRAKHPWRYYVLDWKSDQLAIFDCATMDACIHERHYDLQAGLYCHALDVHLNGILGDAYEPGQNLGGAVYVFLRGCVADIGTDHPPVWTRLADQAGDAVFVKECIEAR